MIAAPPTVTPVAWPRSLYQYGAHDTYQLAAAWLQDCRTVADWGGGGGYFQSCLPTPVAYTLVDGTMQTSTQVLADLTRYHEPSDGILLRHVLDNTHDWAPILRNALAAFRHRLVVVTFTPEARVTTRMEHANGWPTWQFNPGDLRLMMGDFLIDEAFLQTSHPEHIYYLERPR